MKKGQSVRVLDDKALAELVNDVTERVEERIQARKQPRVDDVRELLWLAETIPAERQYWRSLLAVRDREVERWKAAHGDREGHVFEAMAEIRRHDREEGIKIKRLQTQIRELEHEYGEKIEHLNAENQRLLTKLGEWVDKQLPDGRG